MPSSQVVLDGLRAIANTWQGLAIAWHVALAASLAALVLGWRPAKRLAGALFAIPLVSVSALAWLAGNPFNGTVFAILAVGLAGQAVRLPHGRVAVASPWHVAAGGLLTAFGWVYPHFLATQSPATYLYAAPLGLIPCPTLSALVGLALMIDGLGSRWWSMTLALGGAAYGLIGWLRLGVTIDVILLAGAVALGIVAVFRRERVATVPVAGA
jgi:hypothetical protein